MHGRRYREGLRKRGVGAQYNAHLEVTTDEELARHIEYVKRMKIED